MAHNTTVSLKKLTCTNYVDFGKCQDRFGRFSWSRNDSSYLDVKLKVIRKGDKEEFPVVQKLTMGEANFNQFLRLRNQLVTAAKNIAREEILIQVPLSTMSKDVDEQLKLAHKVVGVVDRANRKICVTLLRYNVGKPESSCAQVRFFARKKEDEKLPHVAHVNYKLEEFIYLLDVMNSAYDKVINNQRICSFLKILISYIYSLSLFFVFKSGWVGTLEITETFFSI